METFSPITIIPVHNIFQPAFSTFGINFNEFGAHRNSVNWLGVFSLVDGDEVGIDHGTFIISIGLEISRTGVACVGRNRIMIIFIFSDLINNRNPVRLINCFTFGIIELETFSPTTIIPVHNIFQPAFSTFGTNFNEFGAHRNSVNFLGIFSKGDVAQTDIATGLSGVNPLDVADVFIQVVKYFLKSFIIAKCSIGFQIGVGHAVCRSLNFEGAAAEAITLNVEGQGAGALVELE